MFRVVEEGLTTCIELAQDATDVLNRTFGKPGKELHIGAA